MDRELLDQFLLEGREQAAAALEALLAIEAGGGAGPLADAFRAVHTLKGGAAICDLAPLERLLHAAEDALEGRRAGRVAPGADMTALLDAVGTAETWLRALEAEGTLPPEAARRGADLEARLQAAAGAADGTVAPVLGPDRCAAIAARHGAAIGRCDPALRLSAFRYTPDRGCFFRGEDPLAQVRAVPGLVALDLLDRSPDAGGPADPFRCDLAIEAISTAGEAAIRAAFRFQPARLLVGPVEAAAAQPVRAEAASRTLRVDVARADRLVGLASELVVAHATLAARLDALERLDPALARSLRADLSGLGRIAGELHRGATALRLTPLARTFRRFPLPVRDMAAALGKTVRLLVEGDAVEADRRVVDGLFEPLLHLLRNAVDHGIEPAAERMGAGKQASGTIRLGAETTGAVLVVTLADDGGGINPAAIGRQAEAQGLRDAAAIASLDAASLLDLVFLPGFSTASTVTEVSGRGIGMDAVRRAIEALGGRVSLSSVPGAGTTVRLVLPQAATLTRVVVVEAGGLRLGVPQGVVAETARVAAGEIRAVGGGEAFVLRDRAVTLRGLAALLALDDAPARGPHANVLLLESAAGSACAIEVDAVLGRADLLLRPPEGLLARLPALLGTAIEADGRPLLVLDLAGLAGAEAAP